MYKATLFRYLKFSNKSPFIKTLFRSFARNNSTNNLENELEKMKMNSQNLGSTPNENEIAKSDFTEKKSNLSEKESPNSSKETIKSTPKNDKKTSKEKISEKSEQKQTDKNNIDKKKYNFFY